MKIETPTITSNSSSPTSSITTHSLASSTDSSSSSSTPSTSASSSSSITRCQGLNMLVKAIYQVTAGSVVGVPYFQKRVTIRRSRRSKAALLSFTSNENLLILTESSKKVKSKAKKRVEETELLMRQRRIMALPVKYQDSVLQTLKPKTRNGKKDLSRLAMK